MPENLTTTPAASGLEGYNFAYLDEGTKRMVRRALLKAVAIPGYQVPFASREMPMPYGWGTGGIQVTASIIGRDDVLKVIDQGSDDTTNAVSIRRFFERTAAVTTTTHTGEASIIQTRHRIPEQPLREDQIMVYQVPMPEPLRWLEPSEKETRTLHALEEYGIMSIKLYEDIMRHGDIATGFDYPVKVNGRYIMSPSPIPRFDNPKMHQCPALQLFGAGREKRIYAIPPYTDVVSLDFEDYPFTPQSWDQCCAICGATDTYLDEIVMDDAGTRMFVCSDTDNCARRVAEQGGIRIQALQDVNFDVRAGECVALHGPSGAGKSTLLKTLYGNYLPSSGKVIVRCEDCETDMATASTRAISRVRRECIGYVSQFLRVIPRVSALDLVAEPLLDAGEDRETALDAAQKMLTRLNLPERLWHVAPATFSGGEQQRVNIARGLIRPMPLLLLDEPTASLDGINRQVVIDLIHEARQRGSAIVGIFHDDVARNAVADRIVPMDRP